MENQIASSLLCEGSQYRRPPALPPRMYREDLKIRTIILCAKYLHLTTCTDSVTSRKSNAWLQMANFKGWFSVRISYLNRFVCNPSLKQAAARPGHQYCVHFCLNHKRELGGTAGYCEHNWKVNVKTSEKKLKKCCSSLLSSNSIFAKDYVQDMVLINHYKFVCV